MRMISKLIVILLLLPLQAEPLKPMAMKLNADVIQKIPIHSQVQTLLLFPEPVTLVLGEGLSDGKTQGKVQAQLAEDKRVLIVRSIEAQSEVLMQVMVGEEAYAFRLQYDEQPASIIRFGGAKALPKAKEVSADQAREGAVFPSEARQRQLLRLAKQANVLQSQLPDEYEGYQAKNFETSSWGKSVSCTLQHVARFPKDHALVVFGMVTNLGEQPITEGLLGLQVGKARLYPLPFSGVIKAGETYRFATLLLGDGAGNPLHLSLENDFKLIFKPQQKKQ